MRILVVEDDKDLNRQVSEALIDAGYVVDGHLARRALSGRHRAYDAVVLDISLPQMDGINVLERWRQDGRKMRC